jgi:hypothetical protein
LVYGDEDKDNLKKLLDELNIRKTTNKKT